MRRLFCHPEKDLALSNPIQKNKNNHTHKQVGTALQIAIITQYLVSSKQRSALQRNLVFVLRALFHIAVKIIKLFILLVLRLLCESHRELYFCA